MSQNASETHRLSVRLARNAGDLAAVQHLRWQVFVEEMGAEGREPGLRLERDPFDAFCDHLLVTCEDCGSGAAQVVGTYRLLRESVARRHGGFYSSTEFDLRPLLRRTRRTGDLLELGRSCVLPDHRNSHTISLLWRGISSYVAQHNIAALFGCASFPGTDPEVHAAGLSYLAHHHLAPDETRPLVRGRVGIPLERLARGSYDERGALMSLPPLIKGYLRTGAQFGEGAFVDHAFRTIDVCVILPVDRVSQRYANRFNVAA
ncbi:GNAT family N-acetyltransferase [Novosphingobium flavum]|uniref:L-ornithine N(alpha)-acyltransferase n=1 Tax=Novosphingobium flavum TaxID=1778672 RepID=A0A7X1KNF4_9SPHN|nr:GNAT family N-acyltransferase [Novosphingobium flavum]MBC2667305.1 GNAT family N-acetyltransferase [Novosphingobium flavum]